MEAVKSCLERLNILTVVSENATTGYHNKKSSPGEVGLFGLRA